MLDLPVLSLIIWLPVLTGFLMLFIGSNKSFVNLNRNLALFCSIITFAISAYAYCNFDQTTAAFQFTESFAWLPVFNINYHLAADGISLPLILLTTFFTPIVLIASWHATKNKLNQFMAAFLMMAGLMVGVFAARDAILFYFFFEATLIPMFLIIGIWGGTNRIQASIKFFLYTFLGSILMLVALLYLANKFNSFDLSIWTNSEITLSLLEQQLLFLGLFFAFAVKVPMWPIHTWLPHAHVEAPTSGSVILAAIMLKMGGYGMVRFCLPIVPLGSLYFSNYVIAMSLIAIVYIGLVAITQKDMKRLIAYSSVAHMGFVTLGFFIVFLTANNSAAALMGMQGAMLQMISHGFISGALFLVVGVLYDRLHTREIADYGGVANTMPKFASLAMLFCMANVGLPGTSGFVGEFLVIMASFHAGFWIAFFAATTLIFAAAFTLWMYKRVMFGQIVNPQVATLKDINSREKSVLVVLAVTVLFFGIYPKPLTDLMEKSLINTIEITTKRINSVSASAMQDATIDNPMQVASAQVEPEPVPVNSITDAEQK